VSASPARDFRSILAALFGAAFATMLGAGIVSPLLPVYAREHGAGGLLIGFIFASFSLTRTAFLPYFGRLSDRRGRRGLIVIGLCLYAVCSFLYAAAVNPAQLVLVRLLQGGAAAMVWPIAAAYVGDITPPGREGTYMGLFNLATYSGLASGPFIGGLIKDLINIQACFHTMGGMSLLGLGLAFVFLPQQEPFRTKPTGRSSRTLELLRRYPELRGAFLFRLLISVCIALSWSFQPLYLDAALGLPAAWIGLLVSLNVSVMALLQAPLGRLADRVDRRKLILIGALIQATCLSLLPLGRSLGPLLALNLGLGVASGIFMPALQAIVTSLGRLAGMIGAVMGLLFTAQSLGMLCGPMIAGALYEMAGFSTIFWVGGGLSVTSLIPLLVYLRPGQVSSSSVVRSGR